MWKSPFYKINQPLDWAGLQKEHSWIQDMENTPQDPEWHSEGNVLIHTQMVVEALISSPEFKHISDAQKHIVVTAAIFHDIEKRSTTSEEERLGKLRIVSPGHAKKGEYTVRQMLYKHYEVPYHVRELICKLVRHHSAPIWILEKEDPDKEVIYLSQILDNELLYLLAKADMLGRICDDQEDAVLKVDLFKELCLNNDCFNKAVKFESASGRYVYLNKSNTSKDYVPYDISPCTVKMLVGLPGTGKDTYIKKTNLTNILSLDDLRREHKISHSDKKGNGRMIQLGKDKAREYLRSKTDFVFNATNITLDMRSKWISLFKEYKAKVKIIYLEVPYKTLLKQNHNREYKIPESALEKLILRLEPPTVKEADYIVKHVIDVV